MKYIGTRGMKLDGNWDLNEPNVFYNDRLFDALERTRRGEDVELFDQMFLGLNLNSGVAGCDRVEPDGRVRSGKRHNATGLATLAVELDFPKRSGQWNFAALANSLNVYNGVGAGNRQLRRLG